MSFLKQYKWIVLITILSFIVRLVLIYFNPRFTFQEDVGLTKLALSIATGHGYGYEGLPYWGYPPGAATLMASMYLLFGDGFTATRVLQALIDSFGCVLIYLTCRELFNRRIGIIAAILYAIFLPIAFMSTWIAHDALLPFLVLSIFYTFILAIKRNRWYYFVITGIVTGISCYFQPTTLFLPILLGIGYYIYSMDKSTLILIGKNILLVLISMVIVILPWMVRNYKLSGIVTPMRSAGWVTIYCGFAEFGNCPENITLNDLEQLRLDSLKVEHKIIWGSKEYEDYYKAKVITFIKEHPLFVLKTMIRRIPLAIVYKPEMGLSNYQEDPNWYDAVYGSGASGIPSTEYLAKYPQFSQLATITKEGKLLDYIKTYPKGAVITLITLLYIMLPLIFSAIGIYAYRKKWRELILISILPVYFSIISILVITINAKNKVPGSIGLIIFSALAIYWIYNKLTTKRTEEN